MDSSLLPASILQKRAERARHWEVLASSLEGMDAECLVDIALHCVEHTLPVWGPRFAADDRPALALASLKCWEDHSSEELVAMGFSADDARIALDSPEYTEDQDPERARAMHQASAVSSAAFALAELKVGHHDAFRTAILSTLVAVTQAAPHEEEERAWQLRALRAQERKA